MADHMNGTPVPTNHQPPLSAHVTVHNGQVVLHLSEPREYVALTDHEPLLLASRLMVAGVEAQPGVAQAAIAGAMGVIDAVYELRREVKPAGGAVKHELIERHRRVLVRRLEVMLNSLREAKKVGNAALAKQLTDVVLSEVFS